MSPGDAPPREPGPPSGLQLLAAFAWLRLRQGVNAFTRTGRRSAAERAAGRAEALLPLATWLFLAPAAVASAVLGFAAGMALTAIDDPSLRVLVAEYARFVLLVVLVSLATGVVFRLVQGLTQTTARIALLPVPREQLHRLEVAASFADPSLALLAPGLLLVAAGVLAGGQPVAAALALAAGILLLLFLGSGGALLSFAASLLLRRRARREGAGLLLLLGLLVVPALPYLLIDRDGTPHGAARGGGGAVVSPPIPRQLPTELYVRAVTDGVEGRPDSAVLHLAVLGALACVTYALSGSVYRALLDHPPEGGAWLRRSADRGRLPRGLPLVPDAVAAVALAEVRLVARTVQGRMSVVLAPLAYAGLACFFLTAPGFRRGNFPPEVVATGGVLFCLMGLHGVLFNLFGIDRTGLTRILIVPLSDREILAGKLLGGGLLFAVAAFLFLAPTLAVLGASWDEVAIAALLAAGAYLLAGPVGALLSIVFPKSADLGSLGPAGRPHEISGLVAFFAAPAAVLPAALVVGLGRAFLRHGLFAPLLLGAWTLFLAGVSLLLFEAAARSLGRRRESLALAARPR